MSESLAKPAQPAAPGSHRANQPAPGGAPAQGPSAQVPATIRDSMTAYWARVRNGELGSLPAVLGIVLLVVIFAVAEPKLLTAGSFASILQDAAAPITLALGLVFVLLLGEIDLAAGVVGAAAAGFGALWTVKHGMPWWVAIVGAVLFGTASGTVFGVLRARLGIPSFVVTLAAYLSFQGIQQFLTGTGSGLSFANYSVLVDLDGGRMSPTGGWILLVISVVGYALVKYFQRADRRRQGLPLEAVGVFWARIVALAVGGAVFVYVCNINELTLAWQKREGLYLGGVPWLVPIIAVLTVILSFMLSKTRYGRHVYAVGGNAEAARRAGIPVRVIRTSVFAVCSALSAISGLFLSSQIGAANATNGLGNTLLLGVAAAVIGGTSLAGGRGRAIDAVLGGLALTVLTYGMSTLISGADNAQWEFIITGIVLLIAAGVDATSRHAGREAG